MCWKINLDEQASNKVDFEREEPTKQELQQKKVAFSDSEDNLIHYEISKYGYGRWTSILNDPSFKFHPLRKLCTLAVRAKKIWFCDKGQFWQLYNYVTNYKF